ncbi:YbaN family protein [Gallaecimonas sp. GXIMD4217]|uniref:YbaN family protein n=1 Tax=Gallaecimonas sp. GXIMD4217 TaxID=3131927 RepID=UPI00311B2140
MVKRYLFLLSGWTAIALGTLGVVLPVLPTTPFILLAAWCFAKGSPRWHHWLRNNRYFGQMVTEWEVRRALRRRYRNRAIALMVVTFAVSLYLVPLWWVRGLLVALMLAVITYLMRLPVIEEGRDCQGR